MSERFAAGRVAVKPAVAARQRTCARCLRSAFLTAALALFTTSCGATVDLEGRTAEDFYDGVRLDVIVPFGPGGGTDTWARLIAPFLQRELGPGSSVQIINIAGATSVAGGNDFAMRRRPDGRTAFISGGSTFFAYLLGEPMVRFDFREMRAIVSSPAGGVVFIRPDMGIRSAAELRDVQERLIYGGISAAGNDLLPLLAFELLGLDILPILGYGSKGTTRIAFEQGETNIEYQTAPAYRSNVVPLVEQGLAVPLFSFGLLNEAGDVVRDPVVPDLPTVLEVYRSLNGRDPSGPAWEAYRAVLAAGIEMQKVLWLHGDAPEAAVEALRAAARKVIADPDFREEASRRMGDYPFHVGEEVERLFSLAVDIPPEAKEWLTELLRTRYGINRL